MKIFGYYPTTLEYNFNNSNPEKVANFKDNFSRNYENSQLLKDTSLYNLEIINIFNEYYIIRVQAYLPSKCRSIMDEALKYLTSYYD